MGIDSIGKAKGPAAALPTAATGGATGVDTEQSFHVGSTKTTAVQSSSPLDQLRAGKIDVPQYLDLKVAQATAHLEGKLSEDKLQWIKQSLRAQLEQDPMLERLVRSMTRNVPSPSGSNHG